MRDIAAFLSALPNMGVSQEFAEAYRAHLSWATNALTRMGRSELGEREIPTLLEMARKAGASDARVRNLETACRAYVRWWETEGRVLARPVASPVTLTASPATLTASPASRVTRTTAMRAPAVRARGVPRSAVFGLISGAALMLGLIAFRPSRETTEPAASEQAEPQRVIEPAPTSSGSTGAPVGACAQLQRCCDERGAAMFCAVAKMGTPAQCRSALSNTKELEGIDCRAVDR